MSLKHGILGLLNYGSMTGYELNKAFESSLSFFWQAQTSQIYRELGAMEREGWLTSRQIIQTDKPNKRLYSLTPAGREELLRWLSLPEAGMREAMTLRSAFLIRVFFAGEMGDDAAIEMLQAFHDRCAEALPQFCAGQDAAIEHYGGLVNDENRSKYWKLTALFGALYYQAEMEWAKQAIEILEEST